VKMFDASKTKLIGLPYGEKADDMLSRFHLIPERYGRTDRQTGRRTDRIAISISRVSVLTRDKKWNDPVYTNLSSAKISNIISNITYRPTLSINGFTKQYTTV